MQAIAAPNRPSGHIAHSDSQVEDSADPKPPSFSMLNATARARVITPALMGVGYVVLGALIAGGTLGFGLPAAIAFWAAGGLSFGASAKIYKDEMAELGAQQKFAGQLTDESEQEIGDPALGAEGTAEFIMHPDMDNILAGSGQDAPEVMDPPLTDAPPIDPPVELHQIAPPPSGESATVAIPTTTMPQAPVVPPTPPSTTPPVQSLFLPLAELRAQYQPSTVDHEALMKDLMGKYGVPNSPPIARSSSSSRTPIAVPAHLQRLNKKITVPALPDLDPTTSLTSSDKHSKTPSASREKSQQRYNEITSSNRTMLMAKPTILESIAESDSEE